jgi:hypothetical protein
MFLEPRYLTIWSAGVPVMTLDGDIWVQEVRVFPRAPSSYAPLVPFGIEPRGDVAAQRTHVAVSGFASSLASLRDLQLQLDTARYFFDPDTEISDDNFTTGGRGLITLAWDPDPAGSGETIVYGSLIGGLKFEEIRSQKLQAWRWSFVLRVEKAEFNGADYTTTVNITQNIGTSGGYFVTLPSTNPPYAQPTRPVWWDVTIASVKPVEPNPVYENEQIVPKCSLYGAVGTKTSNAIFDALSRADSITNPGVDNVTVGTEMRAIPIHPLMPRKIKIDFQVLTSWPVNQHQNTSWTVAGGSLTATTASIDVNVTSYRAELLHAFTLQAPASSFSGLYLAVAADIISGFPIHIAVDWVSATSPSTPNPANECRAARISGKNVFTVVSAWHSYANARLRFIFPQPGLYRLSNIRAAWGATPEAAAAAASFVRFAAPNLVPATVTLTRPFFELY